MRTLGRFHVSSSPSGTETVLYPNECCDHPGYPSQTAARSGPSARQSGSPWHPARWTTAPLPQITLLQLLEEEMPYFLIPLEYIPADWLSFICVFLKLSFLSSSIVTFNPISPSGEAKQTECSGSSTSTRQRLCEHSGVLLPAVRGRAAKGREQNSGQSNLLCGTSENVC